MKIMSMSMSIWKLWIWIWKLWIYDKYKVSEYYNPLNIQHLLALQRQRQKWTTPPLHIIIIIARVKVNPSRDLKAIRRWRRILSKPNLVQMKPWCVVAQRTVGFIFGMSRQDRSSNDCRGITVPCTRPSGVNASHSWPRVLMTRRWKPGGGNVRRVLGSCRQVFPLWTTRGWPVKKRGAPSSRFFIGSRK